MKKNFNVPQKYFSWTIFMLFILAQSINAQPKIECELSMPDELIFDPAAKDFAPNPFPVVITVTNIGDQEALNGVATITFNKNDLKLVSPLTTKQNINPSVISGNGGIGIARWDVYAKKRTVGDYINVCITVTFDNHHDVNCCKKNWIPQTPAIMQCSLSAPEIKTNIQKDRYIPMPFVLTLDVVNEGGVRSDSLFASIYLTPKLQLDISEGSKTIKSVSPPKLQPGQHGTVTWNLWHPIALDPLNYQVKVCVRQKNIDSSCCELPIIIPPLSAPSLASTMRCPGDLVYDSIADKYNPNPFQVTVSVVNVGGLDADSVKARIILPPDIVLDPPNQPLTKYFNPMKIVKWKNGMPANELTWSLLATKKPKARKCYTITYRIDGISTSGPTDPDYGECDVCVPGVQPLLSCDIYGPDSLTLNSSKTGVLPNPFNIRYVVRNIGKQPYGVRDAQLFIFNGPGVNIQPSTPNPFTWNKVLNPGDTIDVIWKLQVTNSRVRRIPKFTAICIDEDGDPLECFMEIPIQKIDVDMNCSTRQPDTIHYDQALKIFNPNPFTGRILLFNAGSFLLNNIAVTIKNLPPEIMLAVGETSMVKIIKALAPSAMDGVEWQFQLTLLGKLLKHGGNARIGFEYKVDSIPLLDSDCFFSVFIDSISNPTIIQEQQKPISFYLGQNYPNPFIQSTTIDLTSPWRVFVPTLSYEERETEGRVKSFKVYDVFGRQILDLSEKLIDNTKLIIDNSQLPSQGIYFYRLTIGNHSQTKMMTFIK